MFCLRMTIMMVQVNSIQITNYRGRGEVNGHVLWEKLKF